MISANELSTFTEVPTSLEVGDRVLRYWTDKKHKPYFGEVTETLNAVSVKVRLFNAEDILPLDSTFTFILKSLLIEPILIREMRKVC